MSDTLPEVAVADATPKTAAIYERIMTLTGVGSPALIYRHFAVFPDLLEWVWAATGPELESGHAQSEALAAVARTPVVPLPGITPAVIGESGIDRGTLRAIFATYNRMNPVNLSLISAVRDLIASPGDTSTPPSQAGDTKSAGTPPPAQKLPPPLTLDEMGADVRAAVLKLSDGIPNAGARVIPTLYRHLAISPALLLRLAPDLSHAMQRGDIQARMGDLGQEMAPLIADVGARARARGVGPAPLGDPKSMVRTLDSFLFTIPQLIVVGVSLARALEIEE